MATAPSPRHKNRGYGQFDATVTVDVLSNSPIFVGRCTRKRRGWAAAATEPSASTMCRPERCTSWSTSSTTSGTPTNYRDGNEISPHTPLLQTVRDQPGLQSRGHQGPHLLKPDIALHPAPATISTKDILKPSNHMIHFLVIYPS